MSKPISDAMMHRAVSTSTEDLYYRWQPYTPTRSETAPLSAQLRRISKEEVAEHIVHGQWGLNIKFRTTTIADRATKARKSGIFTKLQIAALGLGKKVPLLCGRLRTPRRCSDTKGALFYQTDWSRIWVEVGNS